MICVSQINDLMGSNLGVLKFILNIVFLIIGFLFLIKGADAFVDGASKIAAKMNIPQIIIGLTIVAFGTSAPEAAISISAAFKEGASGITVGNILGSNILNILLILGVASCIAVLPVKKNTLKYEMPFVIFVTVLMTALGLLGNKLSRIDGVIFWLVFIGFFVYLIKSAKNGESDEEIELTDKDKMWKLILITLIGMVCIVLGSDITVDAATYIAATLGMNSRIIGLTVVAFGTSLPELITSATAAKKGKIDIAIGNIVGSNIFNILFVVGTVALIHPVSYEGFTLDSIVAIVTAIILFIICLKSKKITKAGGIFMLICYALYFTYIMLNAYGIV